MKEPKNISSNDWLNELKKQWDRPADSFTAEEAIKILGLKKSAVREILTEKVKQGELKMVKWRKPQGGCPCNCYIPIRKNEKLNGANKRKRNSARANDK